MLRVNHGSTSSMGVKEVSITSLESWLSKIRSIRTWNAIIRVAERVLWHRPAAPRPQFPMPLSKIQSEIQKKTWGKDILVEFFKGCWCQILQLALRCDILLASSHKAVWHSRCNYKHLKFTGQVLLNVVQRALKNEQVLESNSKISSRELQRPCCSWDCQKPKRRLGLYLPMAAYRFAAMISPMGFIGSVAACPQSGK